MPAKHHIGQTSYWPTIMLAKHQVNLLPSCKHHIGQTSCQPAKHHIGQTSSKLFIMPTKHPNITLAKHVSQKKHQVSLKSCQPNIILAKHHVGQKSNKLNIILAKHYVGRASYWLKGF
jgi:hypothetical protein